MRRLKLDAADLTPSEIAAKIRRVSTAKASQAKGVHGEELVRRALVATGYCMVERIATPAKLARGRLVYSSRVSGDFRAVWPLRVRLGPANGAERDFGVSVLVECKARDVSLTWTAFEDHQRRALEDHAKLGGISLVGWIRCGRVHLLDWSAIRAAGFEAGWAVVVDLEQNKLVVR